MDVLKSSVVNSTTCSYDTIPFDMINCEVFNDEQRAEEFIRVFNTPINKSCENCYINFCKLLFCVLLQFDSNDDVNLQYNYTKVFIEQCFRDFMQTIKCCPRAVTQFHDDKEQLLTCDLCIGNCVFLIECTATSFYGPNWRPSLSFGIASTHIFRVFLLYIVECKNGCFIGVNEDNEELMDYL